MQNDFINEGKITSGMGRQGYLETSGSIGSGIMALSRRLEVVNQMDKIIGVMTTDANGRVQSVGADLATTLSQLENKAPAPGQAQMSRPHPRLTGSSD